ncbi:thermonuclease family protein [Rhodococcus sp. NPDC127530]|uniref:thermonuclease family protein n=1 Tax=unclassified Rhodococcus (in: high G+C Gram-positive bacteria) TaxID=192944 RepID=UPI003634E545
MPVTHIPAIRTALESSAVSLCALSIACAVVWPAAADPVAVDVAAAAAQVVDVADGDTLVARYLDKSEVFAVSVVGIDAPEGEECWAAQSTQFARDNLVGRQVMLSAEATLPNTDPTGALVRRVALDNDMDGDYAIKAAREGAARAHATDQVRLASQLLSAEAGARDTHRGLWTCDGSIPVAAPSPDPGPRPAP